MCKCAMSRTIRICWRSRGPQAPAVLQPLCDADLSQMAYHTGLYTRVAGIATLVGRTGYTGEDGFELFFPTSQAGHIWDRLMETGKR